VKDALPYLVVATPRDRRPAAPKPKHISKSLSKQHRPRDERHQTKTNLNRVESTDALDGAKRVRRGGEAGDVVPLGAVEAAEAPRRSAPESMIVLHPLQVERPDLAYSTKTADAAGEVDMATRAAEGRRLGFRASGEKGTSMRGGGAGNARGEKRARGSGREARVSRRGWGRPSAGTDCVLAGGTWKS
jgi:hypothetical protein